MNDTLAHEITRLRSDNEKMLLLNNRYYCQLTCSMSTLDVSPGFIFFSEACKNPNCPAYVSHACCYVLDTQLEKPRHKNQFAELCYCFNTDISSHDFSLKFNDGSLVNIVDAKIIDKPYPLKKLMSKLDITPDVKDESLEPVMSLDGVCFIDLGKYGTKSASLEYYISGKLYFEIVDFEGVPDMGIVRLDDASRRDVVVNMLSSDEVLNESNADSVAELINCKMKSLML